MAKKDGLSSQEKIWVRYINRKGVPEFIITSTPARDKYFLYQRAGNLWNKVEKASSPIEFEEKYSIRERISTRT